MKDSKLTDTEYSEVRDRTSRQRQVQSASTNDAVVSGNTKTSRSSRDIGKEVADRPHERDQREKSEHSRGRRRSFDSGASRRFRGHYACAAGGAGDPSDDGSGSVDGRPSNRKRPDDRRNTNKRGDSRSKPRPSSSDNDQLSEGDFSEQRRRRSTCRRSSACISTDQSLVDSALPAGLRVVSRRACSIAVQFR